MEQAKFLWRYFNGSEGTLSWMVCFFHVKVAEKEGIFIHAIVSDGTKLHKIVKMSRSCLELFANIKSKDTRYDSEYIKYLQSIYDNNEGEVLDDNFVITDNTIKAWNCEIVDNSIKLEDLLDLTYKLRNKFEYPEKTKAKLEVEEYTSYTRCNVTGTVLNQQVAAQGWYDYETGSKLKDLQYNGWLWVSLILEQEELCAFTTSDGVEAFVNRAPINCSMDIVEQKYNIGAFFYTPTKICVNVGANQYELIVQNKFSTITSLAVLGTYYEGQVLVYQNGQLVGKGFLEYLPQYTKIDPAERKFFGDYQSYIVKQLAQIYPDKLRELLPLNYYDASVSDADIDYINGPIRYTTDSTGGCWRSALLSLICQMITEDPEALKLVEQIQPYVEMSQAAALIIDDIQDKSLLRRNKPCAYKFFNEQVCLLASELTTFHYVDAIDKMEISDDRKFILTKRIMSAIKLLHMGQVSDLMAVDSFELMDKFGRDGKYESILQRITSINCMKTGIAVAMVFELGALIGSWFGSAHPQILELAYEMGMAVGFMYQTLNDLEDIVKKQGDDLKDNKITVPMVLVLSEYPEDRQYICSLITNKTKTPDQISEVVQYLRTHNVVEKTQSYIQQIFYRSWEKFDRATKPSVHKLQLRAFCDMLIKWV